MPLVYVHRFLTFLSDSLAAMAYKTRLPKELSRQKERCFRKLVLTPQGLTFKLFSGCFFPLKMTKARNVLTFFTRKIGELRKMFPKAGILSEPNPNHLNQNHPQTPKNHSK